MRKTVRKTVIVFAALSITFGFISYSKAESMSFDWNGMGCSENVIFDFELQYLPNQNAYTLDGKAVSRFNGFTYPARGGAVFNPATNNFQVSIVYTSATGETFTFGASLDTSTLSGSGNVQRIAHGNTNDDCKGLLSVL
ncbi:hypothetical protein [Nitrosomonas mobilis]|uniref:Uncharacterized protein n=1 Tax=Nitrosomonas mobilis TaxID=51642 RepID=A0A1G5SB71_9PROT|nr:hypothetical protein [Nitrosomonas mobilis]SCZ84454.1 exported hypothetical protein [Nitrosomonas mobilis]HNO75856.1 hypothetical protein [Nitrosomonas mobilis]